MAERDLCNWLERKQKEHLKCSVPQKLDKRIKSSSFEGLISVNRRRQAPKFGLDTAVIVTVKVLDRLCLELIRPSVWSVSEACRYSCGLVSRHIALPNLLRDKCVPTTWFDDGHIHRTSLPLHCNSFLLSAWFQQPSVWIHLCISCSVSLSAYKITPLVNSIPHVWQMGCRSH